ncbi:MAG: transposase, partial [Erysipelotrichaceae bacterium]|nr:transposase [Erysipelotrichaceae bacterium]
MKYNNNPDYNAEGFPKHCAQNVLKNVLQDIKSYFESVKDWNNNPEKYNGMPKFPHYKRKQGITSFKSSNIECKIHLTKRGNYYCSLPKTKATVQLGKKIPGKLIEVHVTPMHGIYQMSFVFDDGTNAPVFTEHERIIAVDPGIDNLMVVTNNCGLPCILFNGKPLKSVNHLYNRQISNIISENTKGTTDRFVPTPHYQKVTLNRNNRVKDFLLKSAKILIDWCVENRIDTIVLGKNVGWKQNTDMGSVTNQNFVQIPHAQLYKIIMYLADREGISVIEQEESYTSKASFLSSDAIPSYRKENQKYSFSGKRIKRGLYREVNEREINADLNGSANILRKAFPDAFREDPDFNNIWVVRHPDIVLA